MRLSLLRSFWYRKDLVLLQLRRMSFSDFLKAIAHQRKSVRKRASQNHNRCKKKLHLFVVILKKHLKYLCLQFDIFMGIIQDYVHIIVIFAMFDKEKRLVDCPTLLVVVLTSE